MKGKLAYINHEISGVFVILCPACFMRYKVEDVHNDTTTYSITTEFGYFFRVFSLRGNTARKANFVL